MYIKRITSHIKFEETEKEFPDTGLMGNSDGPL